MSDAGATTAPTTTSTTTYTDVTAVHAADLPGGIAAAEAESERRYQEERAAAEAAYAALYPNAAVLEAKAADIVERFQLEPGLWAVGARPEDDIVNVHVDDETLYDTLIEEYGDDPEVVIHLGPNCGILLSLPPPPLPPECSP